MLGRAFLKGYQHGGRRRWGGGKGGGGGMWLECGLDLVCGGVERGSNLRVSEDETEGHQHGQKGSRAKSEKEGAMGWYVELESGFRNRVRIGRHLGLVLRLGPLDRHGENGRVGSLLEVELGLRLRLRLGPGEGRTE